jgi:hypothetical protein
LTGCSRGCSFGGRLAGTEVVFVLPLVLVLVTTEVLVVPLIKSFHFLNTQELSHTLIIGFVEVFNVGFTKARVVFVVAHFVFSPKQAAWG